MSSASAVSVNKNMQQYLTFRLDDEIYGVDILQIQEIRGWGGVRNLPDMPAFIRGVLDLRGTIVPIIDLRLRLGIAGVEYDKSTVIIVVNLECEGFQRTLGLVVDSVSDVLNAIPESIKQTENLNAGMDAQYIKGMVSVDDKLVVLLDIHQLLKNELTAVTQACAG